MLCAWLGFQILSRVGRDFFDENLVSVDKNLQSAGKQ